jgi:hypothetical protein
MEQMAAHCDSCSPWCSCTSRTARSRTSGEKVVDVFIAPYSQKLEPPEKSGRFTPLLSGLGLPDKTRPEEDHASRSFNPAQEPLSRPIQPAANPTKLSEDIVAPFHGLANRANPGLSLASRGGWQAEARCFGTLPGRSIAVGAIGLGRGETPCIGLHWRGSRCWRWHD